MEPPSNTTRELLDDGRTSRTPAASVMRLPIFSSCRQLEYLAHALKRNLRASAGSCRDSRPFGKLRAGSRLSGRAKPGSCGVKKMQPESRVHTRFVGQRWKCRFVERASARSSNL